MTTAGFTGTQRGMTAAQKGAFVDLLDWANSRPTNRLKYFRHGDCIGADEEAHFMVRDNLEGVVIIGHPPVEDGKRAHCVFDIEMAPLPYLTRNRIIVNNSDFLIATPFEMTEVLRSGTWSTIRYAIRRLGPTKVHIIFPDGTMPELI